MRDLSPLTEIGKKRLPEAISVKMCADILGVSVSSVRRWIRYGYIKAYRVGPQLVRIPRSEILRMRAVRMPYMLYGDRPEYYQV